MYYRCDFADGTQLFFEADSNAEAKETVESHGKAARGFRLRVLATDSQWWDVRPKSATVSFES